MKALFETVSIGDCVSRYDNIPGMRTIYIVVAKDERKVTLFCSRRQKILGFVGVRFDLLDFNFVSRVSNGEKYE